MVTGEWCFMDLRWLLCHLMCGAFVGEMAEVGSSQSFFFFFFVKWLSKKVIRVFYRRNSPHISEYI